MIFVTTTTAVPIPTATPLRVTVLIRPTPVDRSDGGAPREIPAGGPPGWPEGEPTWEDAAWL